MKSQLYIDAKAEIVAQVSKELIEHIKPQIRELVFLSANQVAGFFDISADSAKRIFKGKIVKLSAREYRVSLADVLDAVETYKKGKRKLEDPTLELPKS